MMVAATDDEGAGATAMIPLARMADPDEVSKLVAFLASDESSFITAEEHVIDPPAVPPVPASGHGQFAIARGRR